MGGPLPSDGHVLIVDDDPVYRHVIRGILDEAGCVCDVTESHRSAIGVLERILRSIPIGSVSRDVATESEDVADPRGGVARQDRADLVLPMAHARQVWNRVEIRLLLDTDDEIVRHFSRRSARAVELRRWVGPW